MERLTMATSLGELIGLKKTRNLLPKRRTKDSKSTQKKHFNYDYDDSPEMPERFIKFLRSADSAIEGDYGDETTFKVAAKGKDFGLSPDTVYRLMLKHYNPKCSPTWSKEGLRQKVYNAFEFGQYEPGCDNPSNQFANLGIDDYEEEEEKLYAKATLISAAELMRKKFKEQRWAIPGLLPEGLTIIAGPPKTGKSWLALHLAISIATGQKALGRYELEQGTVIYYALEDNQRRLQSRLIKLSEDGEITDGSQFLFMGCELARFDQGGLNDLKKAIQKHPDCRLIIIDTLGKFSPTPDKKLNAYEHDYRVIGEIQKLAMQKQIAIVLITHLRKQQASEALGRVMGSTGITGSADTIWLLVRKSGQRLGTLSITGRDIEDKEFALQFDEVSCEWTTQGDAAVVASTIERQEIIDILESSQFPLSPKEIAEELDKKPANIKALIHKMHKRGILEKVGHGKYRLRTPSDDFGNLSDKNLDMTRLQESNHWDETNQLDDLRDIIGE